MSPTIIFNVLNLKSTDIGLRSFYKKKFKPYLTKQLSTCLNFGGKGALVIDCKALNCASHVMIAK